MAFGRFQVLGFKSQEVPDFRKIHMIRNIIAFCKYLFWPRPTDKTRYDNDRDKR